MLYNNNTLANDLLGYINQFTGLKKAVSIGCLATPKEYRTVTEMSEQLKLVLTVDRTASVDGALKLLFEVLHKQPVATRTTTLGGVSYTLNEYPGNMFPFFLIVLDWLDIKY